MTGLDHQFDYDARTERLLHRLQQPGGVIDPRWPQEMVARTAGWVGHRFSMLNRWNARYNSPSFEAVWAIAEQRSPTISPGSLMPALSGSISTEADAKPDSEPHQFRVRRQTASPPPGQLSSSTPHESSAGFNSVPPSAGESPRQAIGGQERSGYAIQRKASSATSSVHFTANTMVDETVLGSPRHPNMRGAVAGSTGTTATVVAPLLADAHQPPGERATQSRASAQPAEEHVHLRDSFTPTRTSEIFTSRGSSSAPMPLQLSSSSGTAELSAADTAGATMADPSQLDLSPASPATMQRKANTAMDVNNSRASAAISFLLSPNVVTLQSQSSDDHANGEIDAMPSPPPARTSEIYPAVSLSEVAMPLQPSSNSGIEGPVADIINGTMSAANSQTILSPALPTARESVIVQRKANPSSRGVRETPRQGPSPATGPMLWRGAERSASDTAGATIAGSSQLDLSPAPPTAMQRKANTAMDENNGRALAATSFLLSPNMVKLQSQPGDHHAKGEIDAIPSLPPARTSEIYPAASFSAVAMPLQTSSSSGIEGPAADIVSRTTSAANWQTILSPVLPTARESAIVQRKANPSSRVARETPRQGPSPTTGPMIWRRAGTAQMISPARPLLSGGPTAIQRLAEPAASVISSSSSALNSDPLATGPKIKSGINIAQVAEDVGRMLARQLVIERERRGRSL